MAERRSSTVLGDADDVIPDMGEHCSLERAVVVPLRADAEDTMRLGRPSVRSEPGRRRASASTDLVVAQPKDVLIWSFGVHSVRAVDLLSPEQL